MTIEMLKKEYPELYNKVIQQERNRLKEIDDVASHIQSDMVQNAKYHTPISAKELCFQAMQQGKTAALKYQSNWDDDRQNSGVQNVAGNIQQQNQQKEQKINLFASILNQKRGATI